MSVIADDYRKNGPPIPIRDPGFPHRPDMERNGSFTAGASGFPPIPSAGSSISNQQQLPPHLTSSSSALSQEKRLPDDITALLRITIQEGGVQFLSLAQIDTIIEFFTRERDRLTATSSRSNVSLNSYGISQQSAPHSLNAGASAAAAGASGSGYLSGGPPPALGQSGLGPESMMSGGAKNINDLVNNPQVKQALNSLLTLGAIGSNQNQGQSSQSGGGHPYGDMGNSAASGGLNNDRQQQFSHYAAGNAIRRHPLAGSDVSRPPAGGQRGYGSGPGSAASRFQ